MNEQTMQIEVDVTQENIDEAKHKTLCSCPIANSINRPLSAKHWPKLAMASVRLRDGHVTLERQEEVEVVGSSIPQKRITRTCYNFDLPTMARNFASTWDAGGEVRPISFPLELRFHKLRDDIHGGTI